ncbi:Hemocyanin C chain [Portunus trituberculatus]|uniref:Hemocyanin C chain n=1 Tax=Portunus trituberculatus TaxID=210409 RepID=A0A5B7F2G4_PORTR|nr:Hemocyanin C chain [Portunus trituberculatus]
MRLLILCALVAAAAAWPNFGMMADSPGGASDAQKQHDVNSVLWKVYEDIRDSHLMEVSQSFDPLSGHYDDDGVSAKRLMKELNDHRLLEQKHWFSLFNTRQRQEALMLYDYMDNIFREHKDSLTPYTKEELEFSGVSVNDITFSNRLETHFEDFEYNLINAVDDTAEIPDVPISTVVDRLTHNDFTVTLDISNNNDHDVLATVRAFAWPKYDNNHVEFSFNDGRWNAIEMDKFWVKLTPGKNTIKRSSKESAVTVPDVPSFQTLIDKANEALTSGSELHLEEYHSSLGLPNRFLLPKGKSEGMDFHVVAFVSDGAKDGAVDGLHESTTFNHYGCNDGTYPDNQPHGYPLDRRVDDERIITGVSNFKAVDVKVYHVEEDH